MKKLLVASFLMIAFLVRADDQVCFIDVESLRDDIEELQEDLQELHIDAQQVQDKFTKFEQDIAPLRRALEIQELQEASSEVVSNEDEEAPY